MNPNNNLTPIERLKQDKLQLKITCKGDAERLQKNWDHLSDNMGPLLVHIALSGAKVIVGGNNKPKTKEGSSLASFPKSGASVLNILYSFLPTIWEFAQPILIGLAVKKIKKMFSSSSKK